MTYELTGKVKLVQDEQTFGNFVKREVVVTIDESSKYPQDISVDFCQDKVGLLDNVRAGQDVTISFNLRGRESKNRYFNSLQGWKIAARGQASAPTKAAPVVQDEDDDQIPF
jgi:single-strand DNA-binding protein